MNKSLSRLHLGALAFVFLAGFAMAPLADAAGGRGGGGGGGNRSAPQVNNSKADARSNNVRSTSVNNVNNVNVNKNTNVNVSVDSGGCCNNGWDNDHPVARAAVIVGTTAAIVGAMVPTVPAGCAPVNYGGVVYQQCGTTWYQPQGSQYQVVSPPY